MCGEAGHSIAIAEIIIVISLAVADKRLSHFFVDRRVVEHKRKCNVSQMVRILEEDLNLHHLLFGINP